MGCKTLEPEPVRHKLLFPSEHVCWTFSTTDGLASGSVRNDDFPVGVLVTHALEADRDERVEGTFPIGVQYSWDYHMRVFTKK